MTTSVLGLVTFDPWLCRAVLETDDAGRPALALLDCADGLAVARPTVELPGYPLAADQVIVRERIETAGVMAALIEAGIVAATGITVDLGEATGHVCRLTAIRQAAGF